MEVFVAQVINGLALGSIYVLLVTGFNLLLLVALIIHFSFPQVVVFSMYISWIVLKATGNNMLLGFLAGVGSSVLICVATAPLFQRATRKRRGVDINTTMVISLGIGMIITELLSHEFNEGFPIAFPENVAGRKALVQFGLISISEGQVYALAAGGVAVLAFFLILYRTRMGRAFRAIAEDPQNARLTGIPVLKTGILSYALTGLLGGITALLLSILLGSASAGLGESVALKVLAVSIIAGLGNLKGGLIIGILLGVLEALTQGYLSGSWSNAVVFGVMLIVILIKPKGVFGGRL